MVSAEAAPRPPRNVRRLIAVMICPIRRRVRRQARAGRIVGVYAPLREVRTMAGITRRTFFRRAGAHAAAAGVLASRITPAYAKPLGLPIGSQTWPHRAMVQDGNLAALASALAKIGVEAVEMCSPFGYEEFAKLTD